ncbi:MAG: hypothetical protein LBD85_01945 [Oscillospiraceae bacterium]|jgi:hypothetical protein|nr:hypothetical protein [Oscillospiraceae bacterium]
MTVKLSGRTAILIIVIALAGALFRSPLLSSVPVARNQDEASAGYEAWAIANYGIDRNGNSCPVLLESWGSGQNALYSYLAVPFAAAFGLDPVAVRMPMLLLGIAAILLAYLCGCVTNAGFGVAFALVLALNPWHLMISRWALESNILPFFVIAAMFFAERARNNSAMLIPGAAVLALSLYAYGTAFVWVPLFAVPAVIFTARNRFTWRNVFIAALVFAIVAFPIALCHLRNALGLPAMKLFGIFTLPKLTEPRQAATMNFHLFRNGIDTLKLLIIQDDGLPWNSVKPFGVIYGVPGLALAIAGIVFGIRGKASPIPLIALIAGFVTMLFVSANINRANMLLIPLVWFQAYALYWLWLRLKMLSVVLTLSMIAGFAAFWLTYSGKYGAELNALLLSTDNMPYIYCLYDERVPPQYFADTVEYINPGDAFQWVKSFEWRDENGQWRKYEYHPTQPTD